MATPLFSGDEYKDEINPDEWLRMVKNIGLSHFGASLGFWGEILSGGITLMKILDSTPHGKSLKNSSQINSSRIKKLEEMHKIQVKLKESK
jgi:hypothetical protein